jgi:hypothetical protein
MHSGFLDKVEYNFDKVDDVDGKFNIFEIFLIRLDCFALVWILWETSHVNIRKDNNEGSYEEIVYSDKGYKEVPDLAESAFCIDQVPLYLGLGVDNLVFFIGIFIDVVNHHFLKITLSHFLQSGLEP